MVCHIDAAICRQSRVKNLSLPASDFMVQCNGNPCKEVLSPEGAHFTLSHRAILWVQESVIFPVRSQINPFPSKFVKGFFPTIGLLCHTWTPLLLDCPVQVHEKHPFSHSDNFEGQPTLYYAMAGKKWANFPTTYFNKDVVFWPSQHSSWLCYFYSHGSIKFSSSGWKRVRGYPLSFHPNIESGLSQN